MYDERKRIQPAVVGLQEAPFGARVIGEGATLLVVDACLRALFLRRVLHGPQVEAEIVAVRRCHDLPVLGKRRKEQQASNQRNAGRKGGAFGVGYGNGAVALHETRPCGMH